MAKRILPKIRDGELNQPGQERPLQETASLARGIDNALPNQ